MNDCLFGHTWRGRDAVDSALSDSPEAKASPLWNVSDQDAPSNLDEKCVVCTKTFYQNINSKNNNSIYKIKNKNKTHTQILRILANVIVSYVMRIVKCEESVWTIHDL